MKKEYFLALNFQSNHTPRNKLNIPRESRVSSEPSRSIKIPGISDNHEKRIQDKYINKYLNIDADTSKKNAF